MLAGLGPGSGQMLLKKWVCTGISCPAAKAPQLPCATSSYSPVLSHLSHAARRKHVLTYCLPPGPAMPSYHQALCPGIDTHMTHPVSALNCPGSQPPTATVLQGIRHRMHSPKQILLTPPPHSHIPWWMCSIRTGVSGFH